MSNDQELERLWTEHKRVEDAPRCETCEGEGTVLLWEAQRGVPGGSRYGDCEECGGKGYII